MSSLQFKQRKVVEVSWDKAAVKGQFVSIQASADTDHDAKEKRSVENDGHATVTFPQGFTGQSEITVRGSVSGEAVGVVDVT